jgi:hypothetical protein
VLVLCILIWAQVVCRWEVQQLLAAPAAEDSQVELVAGSVPALFDAVMANKAMFSLLEGPKVLEEVSRCISLAL